MSLLSDVIGDDETLKNASAEPVVLASALFVVAALTLLGLWLRRRLVGGGNV